MLVEAGFLLSPPQLQSPYPHPLLPLLRRELLSPSLKCIHTNPTPHMAAGAKGGFLEGLWRATRRSTFLTSPFPISVPSSSWDQLSAHNFLVNAQSAGGQRDSQKGLWKVLETYASILWPLGPAQGLIWSPHPGETPCRLSPGPPDSQAAADRESWVCPTAKPGQSPQGCARSTGTVCLPLYQKPTCCPAPLPAGCLGQQVKLGVPAKGQGVRHSQRLALCLLPAGLWGRPSCPSCFPRDPSITGRDGQLSQVGWGWFPSGCRDSAVGPRFAGRSPEPGGRDPLSGLG